MNAYEKNAKIQARMKSRGIMITNAEAAMLRRAEMTLQKWGEQECGDSNDYCSWAIERDEETNKPYRVVYPHKGDSKRYAIADRETVTLKRVKALCDKMGLFFFHQTDPRGCALYISNEPLTDNNYTNGVSVCI